MENPKWELVPFAFFAPVDPNDGMPIVGDYEVREVSWNEFSWSLFQLMIQGSFRKRRCPCCGKPHTDDAFDAAVGG